MKLVKIEKYLLKLSFLIQKKKSLVLPILHFYKK